MTKDLKQKAWDYIYLKHAASGDAGCLWARRAVSKDAATGATQVKLQSGPRATMIAACVAPVNTPSGGARGAVGCL